MVSASVGTSGVEINSSSELSESFIVDGEVTGPLLSAAVMIDGDVEV